MHHWMFSFKCTAEPLIATTTFLSNQTRWNTKKKHPLISTKLIITCFLHLCVSSAQVFGCGAVAQWVLSRGSHGSFLSVNLAFGFAVTVSIWMCGQVSGKVALKECPLLKEAPWHLKLKQALACVLRGASFRFGDKYGDKQLSMPDKDNGLNSH